MKKITHFIIIALLLINSGCKKNDDSSDNTPIQGGASLTTTDASMITATSAQLGGTIISIGDCALTSHGIAISTSSNPTTDDNTQQDLSITGTGTFTTTVSSLLPNTTYYVRAYAINCKGTNYGNEIQFTTLSGTGADNSYFQLTIDGVTYNANDLLGPHATDVFPEGDTRFALAAVDSASGEFTIASQSSFVLDDTKSFGFSFEFIYKPVSAVGTYTFTDAAINNDQAVTVLLRLATGTLDPTSANSNNYLNENNYSRSFSAGVCNTTNLGCATNTLQITQWSAAGGYIQGTLAGTIYESAKGSINCTNSTSHPYSVNFRLKRVQ